ncbi:MAG TPA: FtsX-like permease family protein [Clostridiales bacterium]|nr:FtsX-like permease family protein [Clostridiales bacterium]
MRSFLTMLGMIIGVGSVITLLGLMQGVTNYLVGTFSELGTNSLIVNIRNTDTRVVDVEDVYRFTRENKKVFQGVTPSVAASYTVKNKNSSVSTSVTGVGEDYLELKSIDLAWGRFISYADIKNRYNACVLGTYIVDKLYDGKINPGDTIRINGQVFTIVGVLEEQADTVQGSSDDCIYIPYSVACRLAGNSKISSYTFVAAGTEHVDGAEAALDDYLYGILKDVDLYSIMNMAELLDVINQITAMMSSILGGIAGISLLVAGIGIMNIMLVSVVERTKEIGIRKSLGAKRRDIMWQFVIEAATISMLGGFIGIVIGSAATTALGTLFKIEAAPTMGSILLAFGVSAAIGIGFGYAPASKAAKLNPIDALRSE